MEDGLVGGGVQQVDGDAVGLGGDRPLEDLVLFDHVRLLWRPVFDGDIFAGGVLEIDSRGLGPHMDDVEPRVHHLGHDNEA